MYVCILAYFVWVQWVCGNDVWVGWWFRALCMLYVIVLFC